MSDLLPSLRGRSASSPRSPWGLSASILLTLLAYGNAMADDYLITDFSPDSADLAWYVVNDSVMGGRSKGDFSSGASSLLFTGATNTNGGGFSSIRTAALTLDLSAYDGICLRVRGDGRRYTWRLSTDARVYGQPVGYWADFDTADEEWTTVHIPFTAFVPQFRGARLRGPALDTSRIRGMGLMIYDKRDGPFRLTLGSVHAHAPNAGPCA
ncbi:MAG: CIA30 family protein [Pseudomonadota bacterium]